jgi:hypothetical protein
MSEILRKHREEVDDMCFRHPWFNLVYNWIIWALVIALGISCMAWAYDVRAERRAASLTATALAEYQAEQNAAETARMEELAAAQASETAVITREAEMIAKLYFGIDRFIEKYDYSEADLFTYARCVFNRVENEKYSDTLEDVINQADQWTGYFENNPILKGYYNTALKAVEEWHSESIKPVSNEYLWAELTPNGIYLKNDFHADGYAIRQRYPWR